MVNTAASRPEMIDISLPISPASVVWPSASKPQLTRRLSIDRGDAVNDTDLFMNVHTGTHIDAPVHHLQHAWGADSAPLDAMIGEAFVIDLSGCQDIDAHALESAWPSNATRVLLKTRNSKLWERRHAEFTPGYAALTENTGDWLVSRGVRLIGTDYLSIQRFSDSNRVHKVLLGAGVVILEGLDLSAVNAGRYELLCLPLKLMGADGAPARAVLRKI
jgi:arylformamidase